MNKALILLAFLSAGAAGCGSAPEPAARVDPQVIEQLVDRAEAQARAADAPEATGARVSRKLASADRVSATLAKVEPEKIDPNLVARLIAR